MRILIFIGLKLIEIAIAFPILYLLHPLFEKLALPFWLAVIGFCASVIYLIWINCIYTNQIYKRLRAEK